MCERERERESRREKRAVSNYFGHASNLCSATTAQPRTTAIQIWSSCRTNLQPERLATNPHRDSYMLTIRQPGDEIGGYESAPPSHQGGSSVHSTPSELASGAHEPGTACEPHPQGRGTERTNPSCRGQSPRRRAHMGNEDADTQPRVRVKSSDKARCPEDGWTCVPPRIFCHAVMDLHHGVHPECPGGLLWRSEWGWMAVRRGRNLASV